MIRIFSFSFMLRFQRINHGITARIKSPAAETAGECQIENPKGKTSGTIHPSVREIAVNCVVETQHLAGSIGFHTCATGSQRMISNNAQMNAIPEMAKTV